jgi:tRNA A-37 threonylcarbamoyl transferase component Bud32
MGTVFKAVDAQGQTVAIKMIGGAQLKGTALLREKKKTDSRINLVREARLAAELRHPNIVEIFDIGQNKGALYVVMELLEGMPLDRYAQTHPITAPEALRIVAQLCDALDCAHNHGIIHRDVKPANTFITADGTVKVLDFGIALPPDQTHALGSLVGTPFYMSPEQVLGQDVDGRADIWSAGVTLFQLLTTRVPFQGRSTAEVRDNILSSATPKLPFAGPFANELNQLMAKALAKDREKRYTSACEFARDLRSVIQNLMKGELATVKSNLPAFGSHGTAAPDIRVRPTYELIKLGFRAQVKNPVFLFPVPTKGESQLPDIPGFIYQIGAPAMAAVAFIYGFAILPILGFLVILLVAWLCLGLLLEFLHPAPFRYCRSCGRQMRSVSRWSRPTRLSEQNNFCVPDCIGALKSGLWEEAVKLLWIHTSEEKSDRQYKLEFFECVKCSDQRANLMLRIDSGGELRGLREAYKFGSPENAQRFFAKTPSFPEPLPAISGAAPTTTEALQNQADVDDQPTM